MLKGLQLFMCSKADRAIDASPKYIPKLWLVFSRNKEPRRFFSVYKKSVVPELVELSRKKNSLRLSFR
jgi:hypothetical protein